MSTDPTPATLVVIPTYNERENIEAIISRVRASAPDVHILVVDDGSPDGTGELVDELSAADPQLHVMHRSVKAGLGAAYIAAFEWGLQHAQPRFDVIVEMDADGSHPPERLPVLIAATADAALVIGSRWIPGGEVVNWPRSREAVSRGGNLYIRLALGIGVRDATAGFRAYRREVLEGIALGAVASQGYCFQVDMAWRVAQDAELSIAEIPIVFVERALGESKMSGAIVREAFVKVTQWGLARRRSQLADLARRAVPGRRKPADEAQPQP